MKREWRTFLTAAMFLTRIRLPKNIDHSSQYLQKSPKYFPAIGWIVGLISFLAFLVFSTLVSVDIGILASMIAGIFVTGALHEDGFADVCDAFGGGWTKEKILAIMKDSRIGSFGTIGLVALLGAKFLLLKQLVQIVQADPQGINIPLTHHLFLALVISAHSLSRLIPVFVIQLLDYVSEEKLSKSRTLVNKKLTAKEILIAIVLAFLPFMFLPFYFLLGIIPVAYIIYLLMKYFKKWIGGYTGDCLGAVQQVSEIVFYLSSVIVGRYFI